MLLDYVKINKQLLSYITWQVSKYIALCIDKEYISWRTTREMFDFFCKKEKSEWYSLGLKTLVQIKSKSYECSVKNIVSRENKSVRPMLLHLLRCNDYNDKCVSLFDAWIQRILLENKTLLQDIVNICSCFTLPSDGNIDDRGSHDNCESNHLVQSSDSTKLNVETETILEMLGVLIKKIPRENFTSCSSFLMDSLNQESDWNVFTNNERILFSNVYNEGVPMFDTVYDTRIKLMNYLRILKNFIINDYNSNVITDFIYKDHFLDILLLIINKFDDQLDILLLICHILQSITVKFTDIDHFEKFIPFLYTSYKRHNNDLNVMAMNILTNLDTMDNYKINNGLYILSQNIDINGNYRDNVDIILVHGINGSPLKTWRTLNDKKKSTNYTLWPKKWLANDIQNIRIISIGFDSKFLKWHLDCPSSTFRVPEASRYLINSLIKAGVGSRPIIWIGHSIGGIVVKNIIIQSNKHSNKNINGSNNLSNMTKGTIFYSVPHHGTPYAFKLDYLSPAFDTKYIKNDCNFTSKLNSNFIKYMNEHGIPCLNFAESLPTQIQIGISFVLIPSSCSDLNYGELIVLNRNHSHTCKPENCQDISYTTTRDFIKNIVNNLH